MQLDPKAPLVVIRPKITFWVENSLESLGSCTWQAFRDDSVYSGTLVYDALGRLWPIQQAALVDQPSFWHIIFPWKRLKAKLDFGTPSTPAIDEVRKLFREVLESDEFDYLSGPCIGDLEGQVENAKSPNDFVRAAQLIKGSLA